MFYEAGFSSARLRTYVHVYVYSVHNNFAAGSGAVEALMIGIADLCVLAAGS